MDPSPADHLPSAPARPARGARLLTWAILLWCLAALVLLFHWALGLPARTAAARDAAAAVDTTAENGGVDLAVLAPDAPMDDGRDTPPPAASDAAPPAGSGASTPPTDPRSPAGTRITDATRAPDTTPIADTGDVVPADPSPAGDTGTTTELDATRALLAQAIVLRASSASAETRASSRDDSLALLADLAASLRFDTAEATLDRRAPGILDGVAALLTLHPDVPITVTVGGTGEADPATDRVLRRKRARTVVTALVARGLDFSRLSIGTDAGDGDGSRRVRIDVGEPDAR